MDAALRELVGRLGGAMQDMEVSDATTGVPSPVRHLLNFYDHILMQITGS
jgi:hypothetical protein